MTSDFGHLDLGGLEALIGDLRERSQPQADPDTLRALIQVADTLGSQDLGDYKRQTALLYAAADLALQRAPELSSEDELHLLAHLETDLPGADSADPGWPARRRERSQRWLAALRQLDQQIDPAFDPGDTPLLNVPAPEGLPAGVSPERISDPVLRQRYEADVAANQAKADRYAQQWRARQLLELYEPRAVRYLGRAYGTSQTARDELDRILDEQGVSGDRKNRIQAAARIAGNG